MPPRIVTVVAEVTVPIKLSDPTALDWGAAGTTPVPAIVTPAPAVSVIVVRL